ncbi:MAG TPA: response regulator [Thermomicrobiales bacterium]|nr:response regulator [Thermomicrobiales bacterium]
MPQKHIAVVNDDTTFLELMEALLSDEGYQTSLMKVTGEAFERIRAIQPDLVIIDIWMQRADNGWEVLNLIRLDPSTAQIPAIVSSTDVRDLEAKAELLRSLNCDVLPKPFNLQNLLDKVNEAIGPPV